MVSAPSRLLNRLRPVIPLGAVLLLVACGSPSTQDMYGGARTGGSSQTGSATAAGEKKPVKLSARRLAAIKDFGLETHPEPKNLIGLSQFDIRDALGEPNFVRSDDGIEIWQYRASNCILDLFLYPTRNGLRVDHTELRGPVLDMPGELDCFEDIVMGRG